MKRSVGRYRPDPETQKSLSDLCDEAIIKKQYEAFVVEVRELLQRNKSRSLISLTEDEIKVINDAVTVAFINTRAEYERMERDLNDPMPAYLQEPPNIFQ